MLGNLVSGPSYILTKLKINSLVIFAGEREGMGTRLGASLVSLYYLNISIIHNVLYSYNKII